METINILNHVSICSNMSQCLQLTYYTLQHVSICYSMYQHVATCINLSFSRWFMSDKCHIYFATESGNCAPYYIPSHPIMHRCFPTLLSHNDLVESPSSYQNVTDGLNEIIASQMKNVFERSLINLLNVGPIIFIIFIFAITISLVWIILLQCSVMVWILICGLIGSLIFGIVCCAIRCHELIKQRKLPVEYPSDQFTVD